MEQIIDIYRRNYWLIGFHLLLLGTLIYALVRIGRHPGPSICFILSALVTFVGFLLGPLWAYHSDHVEWFFEHIGPGITMVSTILLYVAIFGWRSPSSPAATQGYDGGSAGAGISRLPVTAGTVRIPVGWTVTVTILIVLSSLLSLAFVVAMESHADRDIREALAMAVMFGIPVVMIANLILIAKIFYRAWTAVQDEHVQTTPGRAVGFLFIPLFNFYWLFVGLGGLAGAYNAFTTRHRIPVRRLSGGLFYTYCVLALLGIVIKWIPIIGSLYEIITGVMLLVVLWSVTNRINELHATMSGAQMAAPDVSQAEGGIER
jgi:hypothetical protein